MAPFRGSYLPVLMKAVSLTSGPVLELGSGVYSTNPLHWACFPTKRRIVTYENNPVYYDFVKAYARDFHEIHCIEHWDDIDISGPWAVAFVDNDPGPDEPEDRRWRECKRLQHAEYVVLHDSEDRNEKVHRMSEVDTWFKYRFCWRRAVPNTTIYSNVHDVANWIPT
jgi:hypothetical protein